MPKSVEVYYDIAAIPGIDDERVDLLSEALNFRNAAMHLIEEALERQNLGVWEGAEIGMGEINFGFEVTNFETAEQAIRKAVEGTPYDGIRNIERSEYELSDHEA